MKVLPVLIMTMTRCAISGQEGSASRPTLQAKPQQTISIRAFGAKGDGAADDTAAIQRALDAACGARNVARIHVPSGTYNISSPLVPRCAMFIAGDGPLSIIRQIVHGTSNHGISTEYALTLQDISVNTVPLTTDKGMAAVFRKDSSPVSGAGQAFTFVRFNSSGLNFGIDIAGGPTLEDDLGAVLVKECNLTVNTEINAVANPVNVRNGDSLTVEDSTLTGDGNNDHAIYLIGVRRVLIQRNSIRNHGNSAVKLLTGGFRADACPVRGVGGDYSSWVLLNNAITDSKLALAAYTYCDVKLPSLVISDNRIYNILNTYAGDAAAIYIQANCQSLIENVTMSGNVFQDIGLSGVFLLSSIQGGPPCADLIAQGTIDSFIGTGDRFVNFSISYPGAYYAISTSGKNIRRAIVSQMSADGRTNGRAALNLGAIAQVSVVDTTEINLADPGANRQQTGILGTGAPGSVQMSCAWLYSGAKSYAACPPHCFKLR
jgi:Pectate lyase superfamily protein